MEAGDPAATRESWASFVEVLDESIAACSRILEVVRSLRSYARLEESEYKVASINDGLAAAVDLLDPGLRAGVAIDLRLGSVPAIACFPALLNEAFMNVLINACQASRGVEGGRVEIVSRLEGSDIVVEVRDNGVGIPTEHLVKIFDPGFTTKGVGVGLGLGLSVAYLVIREHGGTIGVDSRPGAGTTVTVRLPS
jgi:signal transduction histidine kinase